MHSPNYKKAVCLFFKPAFNFLSVTYCRCNCFYSVGGGAWGYCNLKFERTYVLLKLMKAVDIREIVEKLLSSFYKVFLWHKE